MAELPRYRPLGVSIPSMPSVDYISAAKTKAGVFDTVSNALDKMSEFAFEKQKARVELEGAAYGAANAPTKEQIETAKKPISEMMQIDPTTVFGAAAKAAAAEQIEGRFLVRAGSELTQLRMDAKENDTAIDVFQGQVQNLIDGYSSILQGISPEAANKFAATLATKGNSAIISHNDDLIAAQEQQDDAAAAVSADAVINQGMLDIFTNPIKFTETGEALSLDEQLDVARREIVDMGNATSNPDTFISTRLKAFDDRASELKKATIKEWALEDPNLHFNQIRKGQFENLEIQSVYSSMSVEERNEALDVAVEAFDLKVKMDEYADKIEEAEKEEAANNAIVGYVDARISGNNEAVQENLEILRVNDPDKYVKYSEDMAKAGVISDRETIVYLDRNIANRTLTNTMVEQEYFNGRLSLADFKTYNSSASSLKDENYKSAAKMANLAFGLPELPLFNPSPVQREAQQKVASILLSLEQARTKPGFDIDPIEFVEKEIAKVKTADKAELEEKIKTSNNMADKLRTTINEPNMTLEQLDDFLENDGKNFATTYGKHIDFLLTQEAQ
jgi:hypothetical protein